MSPGLVRYSCISGSTLGSMPRARVTRFLCCAFFACSSVIRPESICSCSREWSRVTTLVVCLFYDNRVLVAQLGDRRAYLLRGGKLEHATRDRSLLRAPIHPDLMTPEQAAPG